MTVYLDHAATTVLRPEARAAWLAASDVLGNPSSVHAAGQEARRLLEESRERAAAVLGCDPIEVVFTSGGTESVNLAIKGLWWSRAAGTTDIVLPDGEHHATLDTVAWLARSGGVDGSAGANVRAVELDAVGRISGPAFADALPGAALATALVANNEVGTINDSAMLCAAAADAGVPLHLDAIGAVGWLDVDFARWRGEPAGTAGLVAMSVSGHKIGAPVGTGALVVSRRAALSPLLHGGGQQRGLRSGTQDVPGAVAFATALEAAAVERDTITTRTRELRNALCAGIRSLIPEAEILGDPVNRLPGNLHVHFPGASGETLLFLLDQAGIAVSTGSACQAGVPEPSHVVLALGRDERAARSVLRLTLSGSSSTADIDALLAALPDAYARAVAAGVRADRRR